MKRADKIISVIIIIMSVYGIIETNTYNKEAAFVPRLILIGLILCSLALGIKSFLSVNSTAMPSTKWIKILPSVLVMVGYVISILIAGFYIATALFLFAMMMMSGMRDWKTLVILPLAFNLSIYIIFSRFLGVMVPLPFFMR